MNVLAKPWTIISLTGDVIDAREHDSETEAVVETILVFVEMPVVHIFLN